MDLSDQRKPNDRLFVDAAEQLRIDAILDLLHGHVQNKTAFSGSHEDEFIFGFEDRYVLHRNHDQCRTAPNENSLQLVLTPRLIKLLPLSSLWSYIEACNALGEPFAIDGF